MGLAVANSLMFTPWHRAGVMSRLVNQAHWGSIMPMIMTASRMGVIEGRWVMGSGKMPRTEESRKWRSTFTKTQVPRWRLMLQLAAASPKWVHISFSKTHRILKYVCCFISQFCCFILLLIHNISKHTHRLNKRARRSQSILKVFCVALAGNASLN